MYKISYNIKIQMNSKFKNYVKIYLIILLACIFSKQSDQYWTVI